MNPSKWELFLLIGKLVRVAYKKVIKILKQIKLKNCNWFWNNFFLKVILVLYYKAPIKLFFLVCLPCQQQTSSSLLFGWWSFCVFLLSLLSWSSSSFSPFHTQYHSLFFTVTFFSFFTVLVTIIMHVWEWFLMSCRNFWWVL